MSAPRFFIPPDDDRLQPGTELRLPDPVLRHALQVLRVRDGAQIVLFDGRGGEYAATLRVTGRTAHAQVGAHRAIERENALPITLVQSLVAADVMDDIVRKAVELGVAMVVPVLAERSQRAPDDRLVKRMTRWRQIAIAACEQCGRNRVPHVADIVALDRWLASGAERSAAVLDADASKPLSAVAAQAGTDTLIVGPEGGLTREEVALACEHGAHRAHLGPRTLRADTAATTALATLNAVASERGG